MENNQELLTNELYESVMESLIKKIVDLKKAQGDTISSLSIQIEILKSLKKQLKMIKKDMKESRKKIHEHKSNLRTINEELSEKNHILSDLNYSFITEGDSYIDLEAFPGLGGSVKKR